MRGFKVVYLEVFLVKRCIIFGGGLHLRGYQSRFLGSVLKNGGIASLKNL